MKLREMMMNFYTSIDTIQVTFSNVPPYREHVRSAMPTGAQDAVRTQCPEDISYDKDGNTSTILPTHCPIQINLSEAVRDGQIVRAIPTFRDDLNRLIADLDSKLFLVDSAMKRSRSTRAQLLSAN